MISAHTEPLGVSDVSEWDKGSFASELVNRGLFPRDISVDSGILGHLFHHTGKTNLITPPSNVKQPVPIPEGTYHGTAKAATEMFSRIEQRFSSYFDVANFESTVPQAIENKKTLYTFQPPGSDRYPPHLNIIPPEDKVGLLHIFNAMRLLDTGSLLGQIIPVKILDWLHDHPEGETIASIESRNKELRREGADIFTTSNIGERPDWYYDAVFAQQQLTGPNPTTIELASNSWRDQFSSAANAQGNEKMAASIDAAFTANSLYVNDYSYFRQAIGAAPTATLTSDDGTRWGVASVSLFELTDDGALHPLAIVIDYKGSMENSIVIFNRRLQASDPTDSERTDWPWRYAKSCAQASDWIRHELTIHLVNCHLIEEATIVASHRSFDSDHPVYRLLQPHWFKTLSLNASARSALVPSIINHIVGFDEKQLYAFINDAYKRFDWTARYVPNDMNVRGFPTEKLATDKKFHNYVYGKNMILMWETLHKFVHSSLSAIYTSDGTVVADTQIRTWVAEMQSDSGAQISTFPDINTFDELVDAVTMCIHIASTQHTAVNYTQEYYQAFVINRQPAMFSAPPQTLAQLEQYEEKDVWASTPALSPRQWLMSSHLPHLLNMKVAQEQNLVTYAITQATLGAQNQDLALAAAANELYSDLGKLAIIYKQNSLLMDDQTYPYDVMNPDLTAVSILI